MSTVYDPPAPRDDGNVASIPFDQSMEVVKRSFAIGSRTVLRPFLVISVVFLLLNGLQPIVQLVQALGADLNIPEMLLAGQVLSVVSNVIVAVTILLIGPLGLGIYRALRVGLTEGPEAVRDQGTFRLMRTRYGLGLATTLVLAIMLFVGIAACILPGLAVVLFFGMFPFLVMAADDDFATGFVRSAKLFLANPGPILAAYGGAVVVNILGFVIGAVLGAIIGGLAAVIGIAVEFPVTAIAVGTGLSSFVGGLVGIPLGYVVLLLVGGTFVGVDAYDKGLSIHFDDELLA